MFGYPSTPAREEVNRDTGERHLTQWSERNRLELHLENPDPFTVLLGRVGDDLLRQRGTIWSTLPRESGPKAGCLWFAETGHNVCDQGSGIGFKPYRLSHGLQNPALSANQRSLLLVGLPLTTPHIETNSSSAMVLMQEFERAHFELHPGKPTQYKVLLGRVGSEVVDLCGPPFPGDFATGRRMNGGILRRSQVVPAVADRRSLWNGL